MNEKIYKTMGRVGGGNIAMGAVLVVVGVVFVLLFTGVLSRPLGWLTTQVYNGIMNLAALPFSFA